MTLLFVPADRPERFDKALQAGADAVIVDLEDAVAAPNKGFARNALPDLIVKPDPTVAIYLRVNGASTAWHEEDMVIAARLPISGIVFPKAESAAEIAALRQRLAPHQRVIAIVETARGLAAVEALAPAADRLAFGSVDFSADLRCAHEREPLLHARHRIVLAARLADRPAPIDGVTLAVKDETAVEEDARYAIRMGFGGKLLIHPAQVEPAKRGLAPGDAEFAQAMKIIATVQDSAAQAVDGVMVDRPVLERARQIVAARERLLGGQ
ncbi:citrate lyase subunit beta/citryl-CoA lyase [Rhizobium aquaticum]|uniref:Citrate lyase subunit beta/citryl-CoA lyase n=1 Tax=Rhizobium aquaticum TaxID=1549636 RepID=A0ABV2J5V2_9HYPH